MGRAIRPCTRALRAGLLPARIRCAWSGALRSSPASPLGHQRGPEVTPGRCRLAGTAGRQVQERQLVMAGVDGGGETRPPSGSRRPRSAYCWLSPARSGAEPWPWPSTRQRRCECPLTRPSPRPWRCGWRQCDCGGGRPTGAPPPWAERVRGWRNQGPFAMIDFIIMEGGGMRIIVTGAPGLSGARLARRPLDRPLRPPGRSPRGCLALADLVAPPPTWPPIRGCGGDVDLVTEAADLGAADAIFHLAGVVSARPRRTRPGDGARTLTGCAPSSVHRRRNSRPCCFSSSVAVFGPEPEPGRRRRQGRHPAPAQSSYGTQVHRRAACRRLPARASCAAGRCG